MKYIEESLGEGERVAAEAHFHWLYTARAVLALLFLGVFLIGIYIFVAMLVYKGTTQIGVTNFRFIKKTGLFTLSTEEISLKNIEGVKVHQGFFGRLFGYGWLIIEGTGVDNIQTPDFIAHPIAFRAAIESAKDGNT